MSDLNLSAVVAAWDDADADAIHPLRRISVDAYWASGMAQAVEAATYLPEGGTVIDYGCGEGRLSIPLTQLGYTVTAVDSSQTMIDRLKQNEADHTVTVSQIIHTDGLSLQVEPVDAVVCRAVLIHHSQTDQSRIVGMLAAVLKPGGHLICDWPTGKAYTRQNWTDVTTITHSDRNRIAALNGLELVETGINAVTPSVWRKQSDAH